MRPLLTRVTSRVRAPRATGLLGWGAGAQSETDKGGGAACVAVRPPRPGPGAPPPPRGRCASPSPLCGCPGRGCEGAVRRRPDWGGRQRATRILATRIFATAGARPQHLRRVRPPALDPDHLFLSLRSTRCLIPGRSPRPGSQFRWP